MVERLKEVSIEYAGFWIRVGACIIDSIILLFIAWVIIHFSLAPLGLGSQVTIFPNGFIMGYKDMAAVIIWLVIIWLFGIVYFVGFWLWRGQTPGKMVLGIKVIRTDGLPISLGYAFRRYLGYIVSALPLFVGYIWIAFDSHKQGFHDKIADTYVIKLPQKEVVLTQSYA